MLQSYVPVVLAFAVAAGLAGALLALNSLFGPSRPSQVKLAPFECGSAQVTSPRLRFSVGFFVVAILFIVFDIEVAFVYPWVVRFRDLSSGGSAAGLLIMGSFLGVLTIGLVYVWKKRVLEWE